MATVAGGAFMDFVQRFQEIQLRREASNELIKDLLLYVENIEEGLRQENLRLNEALNNYRLDLADATNSRRDLQQQVEKYKQHFEHLSQEQNRNPYILVLIDGDGLIFQEHWIKQGLEGGKRAAHALRTAIAQQCGPAADEIEIVAKVVANVSGLARAMRRHGCLDDESDLRDFALGFTQAKATFDFIDVGYGKERADSKIKELTRWHLKNSNCRQILLGVSHDAGYAPFLDEVWPDEAQNRITILEGVPTVRELRASNVNILDINEGIFRTEKLVDRLVSSPPQVSGLAEPPVHATPPISYATVMGKISLPPQMTLPLKLNSMVAARSLTKSAPPQPAWNPGRRGLDAPIPLNQQALDSIKKRKDSNKLCNNHYLRGPCAKGDQCCFEHYYKPTTDELNAIAILARLNPCTSGQDCEVNDCIYGHHCPSMRDGVCTHPYCKFSVADHPPGAKFKNPKIYEN